MIRRIRCLLAVACLIVSAPAAGAQPILKKEPPLPAVPEGKRLLIDDGSCPQGQIKEIIGGNIHKGIRRSRRCIPRR